MFILVANMTEQTTSTDLNGPEKDCAFIAEPLLETKVHHLVTIYPRPEYCQYLVAPKINKMVWQKLKLDIRDVRSYPSQQFILSLKLATQPPIRSVSFVLSTTQFSRTRKRYACIEVCSAIWIEQPIFVVV